MRPKEPWQHDWGAPALAVAGYGTEVVKPCKRTGCTWQMLSRKNSNRYRSGPDATWMGSPKDCKGSDAP